MCRPGRATSGDSERLTTVAHGQSWVPAGTAFGNDGDAGAVIARVNERPVVEDASRVAPELPARRGGRPSSLGPPSAVCIICASEAREIRWPDSRAEKNRPRSRRPGHRRPPAGRARSGLLDRALDHHHTGEAVAQCTVDRVRQAEQVAERQRGAGIIDPQQAVSLAPHRGDPELEGMRQTAIRALEIRDGADSIRGPHAETARHAAAVRIDGQQTREHRRDRQHVRGDHTLTHAILAAVENQLNLVRAATGTPRRQKSHAAEPRQEDRSLQPSRSALW